MKGFKQILLREFKRFFTSKDLVLICIIAPIVYSFGITYIYHKQNPRDIKIALGTNEDELLLREELKEIQNILIKENLIDILAYDLKPLEEDNGDTYEHAYLITFTPAYRLDKQYVSLKSISILTLITLGIIGGISTLILYYV